MTRFEGIQLARPAATGRRLSLTVIGRLRAGFAALLLLVAASGTVSAFALASTTDAEEQTARVFENRLLAAERLRFLAEQLTAAGRGFMITSSTQSLRTFEEAGSRLLQELQTAQAHRTGTSAVHLDAALKEARIYVEALDAFLRESGASNLEPERVAEEIRALRPLRERLDASLDALVANEHAAYEAAFADARDDARTAERVVMLSALCCVLLGAWVATLVLKNTRAFIAREQEALEEARRAVADRDEVLAIVSHDLRNPLGAVLMSGQLLRKTVPEELTLARRQVAGILSAGQRMQHLINDILQLPRLSDVGASLYRRPLEVKVLFTELAALFEMRAADQNVRLMLMAPPSMTVVGDRERLLQVLSNLVGNALKFTPEEGEIQVRAEPENQGVRFSIRDTGPGIPEDHLPHLFDRYWHGGRRGSGLGLGLYISRALVEAHGGKLWAESRLGQGTTFVFTVPGP